MAGGNNKDILIRVRADLAKALKDLDGLEKELEGTHAAGKKAGDGISRTDKSIQFLTRAAGAYLSLRFAKQVFLQADAMQALSTRVRTATKDTGDFDRVYHSLLNTAIETGNAFDVSVGLFQRLALAAPELEASNAQILRLVDSVAQLGVISGASATAQRAGLQQFSQMLSAPVARAEELNSLLENVPEIANRIAHGMEMTTGEFRAAVLAGNVLSKDVFASLEGQADEIAKEFAQLPPTFQRSWSAAVTAASAQLKLLDDELRTTAGWAQLFERLALALQPDSAETALGVRAGELFRQEQAVLALIAEMEQRTPSGDSGPLRARRRQLALIQEELATMRQLRQEEAERAKGKPGGAGKAPEVDPEVVKSILELTKKLQEQGATLGATNEEAAIYKTTLGELKGATDEQKAALLEAARALDAKAAAQDAAKQVERDAAADQDFVRSIETEIQLLGLNERAQAQFTAVAKLSTAATDEQRAAVMELAGALYDLEQATPVKQFEALQNQYRMITDLLSQDISRVQADVTAGLRSELDGRQEIIRLQQTAAQTLERDVLPGLRALADEVGPDAAQGIREVSYAIEQLGETSDPVMAEIRTGLEGSFGSFFHDALRNIDNLSDAWDSLADSILDSMTRVITSRAAQYFVDLLLSGFGFGSVDSGASGYAGDGMGPPTSLAGTDHTGGVAGVADAGHRRVPTAVFAGAPRFHTGGVIGRGEVPIIAKRGEGVFTPAQMAALAPVGAGTTVEVHNYTGEKSRVEKSTGGDGREIVRVFLGEVAKDVKKGGVVAQAMEQTFGAVRQGR